MLRTYYELTKPGIIYGNLITVVAGFLLAQHGHFDWLLLFPILIGIALVMASGCVFNNVIDRDIDVLMERTKNRALVRGSVSARNATMYGAMLGAVGSFVLFFYTNMLTVSIALFGLFAYVVLYTLWTKRTTVHGTLVGSISGAVPPVVGYVAVSNSLDIRVVIIFVILVFWQMAHSYAIAIYRLKDYSNAGIPVLPVKKGVYITKVHMVIYVTLSVVAMLMLTMFGFTGFIYSAIIIMSGLYWLGLSLQGLRRTNDEVWARKMLLTSIVMLLVWCVAVGVSTIAVA